MLELVKQKKLPDDENEAAAASAQLKTMREELIDLANAAKAAKLPVIITIDGWSAAGKGSQIAQLIKYMDPRFFDVESIRTPTPEEKRMPWLHRFWKRLPKQGEFLILDGSWYRDTVKALMNGEIDKDTYKQRIDDINVFERQLTDDGCLLIKLFLHITCAEQKKRMDKLAANPYTAWRVDEQDFADNQAYDKFFKRYDKTLTRTNTAYAPWHIIPSNSKSASRLEIMRVVTGAVRAAVEAKNAGKRWQEIAEFPVNDVRPENFKLAETKKLADINMDRTLSEKDYGEKLKKYQDRLFELQNVCYQRKIPVVIVYEGWDAGGKGGNIKRVAAALDPRGYEVKPIAAPEPSELARHYLWRFWNRLEKDGHFTVFDRSWYGRVMVEVLENLTPAERTEMAYQEINEFEKMLTEWGAVVIKFWINIDKDEQLRRFEERQNTPSKQWKITDEDWRNREKWDDYEKAVDKMIALTSTEFAPWTVIEGNDKKYARIKALKTICRALEEHIR